MIENRNAVEIIRTRAMIEVNIERCRDSAAGNLVEIGRWLNRAKKENVVPHGEWTAWVMEHAGMNERTAQRMMQAARELPEGSPLERLGIAKLSALLTLPAGEREEAAEAMDAQHISSREVADKVAAMRRERDEALRLVGEQKKRIAQMQDTQQAAIDSAIEAERHIADARKQQEIEAAVRKAVADAEVEANDRWARGVEEIYEQAEHSNAERLEAARSRINALEQRLMDARAEGKADAAAQYDDRIAAQKREYARLEEQAMAQARELADVKSQLLDAQRKKPDEEALARMTARKDEAEKRCAEAERELDRLTDELDEARTAALRSGSAEARRSPESTILSAIGALMAEAGRAPGELARQASIPDEETRALLIGQARMLGQWAMQVIAACGGEAHGGV